MTKKRTADADLDDAAGVDETSETSDTSTAATDDDSASDAKRGRFLDFVDAIGRVVDHASGHGEVYEGATADHDIITSVLEELRQELGG